MCVCVCVCVCVKKLLQWKEKRNEKKRQGHLALKKTNILGIETNWKKGEKRKKQSIREEEEETFPKIELS